MNRPGVSKTPIALTISADYRAYGTKPIPSTAGYAAWNTPSSRKKNRDDTRVRMRKTRSLQLFDKSKVILTELVERQADKCYLTQGSRWLMMRLTKASPLSRLMYMRDNRSRLKRVVNRLPRGHLYDVSSIF